MVFTKLLLENALAIRPCNYGAASKPLFPKVARCVPVLSSCYIGKCAARILKRSAFDQRSLIVLTGLWEVTFDYCCVKAITENSSQDFLSSQGISKRGNGVITAYYNEKVICGELSF